MESLLLKLTHAVGLTFGLDSVNVLVELHGLHSNERGMNVDNIT
jgi:hypothetical protein